MFYRLIRSAVIRNSADMPRIAQYLTQLQSTLNELGVQVQTGQQVFGDKQRIVWQIDAQSLQQLQENRQRMAQAPAFAATLEQGRNFFVEGRLHDAIVEVWGDQQQQPSVSSFGGSGSSQSTGSQPQSQQSQQLQTPYTTTSQRP